MRAFHGNWFWVAVVSNGLVGLWGLGLAVAKKQMGQLFVKARAFAILAMLVQVGAGLWMYGEGSRPPAFHMFYGVVILFTFSFAYIYRSSMARRPALAYGLLLLFVMGLGIRAWTVVAG